MTVRCLTVLASVASCALAAALTMERDRPPLAKPAPVEDGRSHEVPGWQELACAQCHTEIAREWAGARHALAWKNERYQEALAEMRRPESCHGCHIPEPLHARELGRKPAARSLEDAHFGIRCESCHEAPESTAEKPVVLGPYGAATSAHGSRREASFLPEGTSALCIGCHATNIGPVIGIAKDFVATKQHERGRSCVGCHMQSVERAIANEPAAADAAKPVDEAARAQPYPVRAGRSHALQTPRDPAFLRRAFVLSARRVAGRVAIGVANDCGHRVPGLIDREIVLAAELLDASGATLARAERTIDARSPLAVDASFDLDLAGDGPRVRIRGTHSAAGFAEPVPFLDETIDVGP